MQDTSGENKLRLMLIYASVYPEKFEGDKAAKLMQVFPTSNILKQFEFHLAYH